MSSDRIALASSIRTYNYLRTFGAILLIYDHLLTVPAEIKYIWTRPRSVPSIFFFINRYFALTVSTACTLVSIVTDTVDRCSHVETINEWTTVGFRVVVAVLLLLRTMALYNRSRGIVIFAITLSASVLSVITWSLVTHKQHGRSKMGCEDGLDPTAAIFFALDWELGFAYDLILFLLTLFKTYTSWKHLRGIKLAGRPPLSVLLLRDGTIYFAVMTMGTLPNIITFYLPDRGLKGSLSTFATSISVIATSRLILSLHRNARGGYITLNTTSEFVVGPSTWTAKEEAPTPLELDVVDYDRVIDIRRQP